MTDEARDRLTRWRLVLGEAAAEPLGEGAAEGLAALGADDRRRDEALEALYDSDRRGGLGGSAPRVSRWLGDIRGYFPTSVVQVMQADAMDRLGLRQLLLEPEMLQAVTPDVHLVSTLVGLGRAIPEHSRETARAVVRTVTDQLEERLRARTVQAVTGALDRSARSRRPKLRDIDWRRTIVANLKHYLPEHRTVVPERLVGFARRTHQVERDIVLCIDQSGSMAESVVYASVFGAVLASLRSVQHPDGRLRHRGRRPHRRPRRPGRRAVRRPARRRHRHQPRAGLLRELVERPADTVLVLISDLFEGGIAEEMLSRASALVGSGVTVVALLALSDSGHPSYDVDHAAALAGIGVPAFACTPDLFPDLMAAAIERRDLTQWAAANDLVTTHEPG